MAAPFHDQSASSVRTITSDASIQCLCFVHREFWKFEFGYWLHQSKEDDSYIYKASFKVHIFILPILAGHLISSWTGLECSIPYWTIALFSDRNTYSEKLDRERPGKAGTLETLTSVAVNLIPSLPFLLSVLWPVTLTLMITYEQVNQSTILSRLVLQVVQCIESICGSQSKRFHFF